jgi:hypothetical protein
MPGISRGATDLTACHCEACESRRRRVIAMGHVWDVDLVCKRPGCGQSWDQHQLERAACAGEVVPPGEKQKTTDEAREAKNARRREARRKAREAETLREEPRRVKAKPREWGPMSKPRVGREEPRPY